MYIYGLLSELKHYYCYYYYIVIWLHSDIIMANLRDIQSDEMLLLRIMLKRVLFNILLGPIIRSLFFNMSCLFVNLINILEYMHSS